MARSTPKVVEGTLEWTQDSAVHHIAVGSAAWFTWLESAHLFAFKAPSGTFTARKERTREGRAYWRAYRKHAGRLYRAYLGKEYQLTLACLAAAAQRLARTDLPIDRCPDVTEEATPPVSFPTDHHRSSLSRAQPQQDSAKRPKDDVLLVTKITPPVLRAELVARPQLIEYLHRHTTQRLLFLAAPAGFGKTTLLAQWLAQEHRRAAWLSLDPRDNDHIRFWRYVITALQRSWPGIGRQALVMLQELPPEPIEAI